MLKGKPWPKVFTVPYLAERAGLSRFAMRRRLQRIARKHPELQTALDARQLTLSVLRALDPSLFDSIRIGESIDEDSTD